MVCHSRIAKHDLLHGAKGKSHPSVCLPAITYCHLYGKIFSLLEKNQGKLRYKHSPEKSSLMNLWDLASDIPIPIPMHWNGPKVWVMSTERRRLTGIKYQAGIVTAVLTNKNYRWRTSRRISLSRNWRVRSHLLALLRLIVFNQSSGRSEPVLLK